MGLIPGLGRPFGGGNGNPLLRSCLGNPTDRWVWWATVHWVAKSQTWLSKWTCTVGLGSHTQRSNQALELQLLSPCVTTAEPMHRNKGSRVLPWRPKPNKWIIKIKKKNSSPPILPASQKPARLCFLSPGYSSLPRGPPYSPRCCEHPWMMCPHIARPPACQIAHSSLQSQTIHIFVDLSFLYFLPSDSHIVPLMTQWMTLWHLMRETSPENLT